jgi:hypothetical protein
VYIEATTSKGPCGSVIGCPVAVFVVLAISVTTSAGAGSFATAAPTKLKATLRIATKPRRIICCSIRKLLLAVAI